MPNQRDPDKVLVGMWLFRDEARQLFAAVALDGYTDRCEWIRAIVRAKLRKHGVRPEGLPATQDAAITKFLRGAQISKRPAQISKSIR